jgi:hypothetical protein
MSWPISSIPERFENGRGETCGMSWAVGYSNLERLKGFDFETVMQGHGVDRRPPSVNGT